jgi:quercetin 2,3-dioxygenase
MSHPHEVVVMAQNVISHLIHDRNARGHSKIGWLDSYHTFSFSNFYDPNRMGFRALRVINEDRVIPGAGFGTHRHKDMEILTYVLEGALEHEDSLGTGSVIMPGEAQIMSAGTGITHSEFNHSPAEPVHFLQIWLLPDEKRLTPRYEQRAFPLEEKKNKFCLIAAKDGREGAVTIHQEVDIYAAVLEPQRMVTYEVQPNRYAWLQIARGQVTLNGQALSAGDGVQINGEEALTVGTDTGAEILLFDLA